MVKCTTESYKITDYILFLYVDNILSIGQNCCQNSSGTSRIMGPWRQVENSQSVEIVISVISIQV